jgi:hypothetical protein
MRVVRASIWSKRMRASSPWCGSNLPSSAWASCARLARSLPFARSASAFGFRCPAISASIIARTDWVSMLEATEETLISARSSSFSSRAQCRVRSCTRSARSRVNSRSRRMSYGGTNDGRSMPRSVSFASHTASFLSVLARPGTFLTARALTSCTLSPAASSTTCQIRQ